MSAADADAEQPRQGMHHLDGVSVFAALAHPGDGIQRIVEKMRVDLRLQCPYLCHFNFLTKLIMLLHQPLDFLHHTVKIVINFLNFIFLGCDWQICVQISAFQTRHFHIQLFQSSNVVTGKKI